MQRLSREETLEICADDCETLQSFMARTSELSRTVAAMENRETEKQPKSLKSRFFSFFKLDVKRRGNKEADLQPPLDTDSADPQPGPSHLESTTHQDHTDPQPGPSSIRQGICVPNPEEKKKDGSTLIKRAWRTVKHAAGRLVKRNSAAPPRPQPDTDSAHLQPDPSVPEQKESLDPSFFEPPDFLDLTDLELDPSFFEPPDFLDLTDLLPSFPESPGAASKESEDLSWLRTISCPGPSPLPLSELYDVEEDIGRGYFGTVRKGIRKSDGQQVAIKFIRKLTSGRFADRFITVPGVSEPLFAEVALNLLLNRPPLSPYIVHMLDWFEEEDQYILILEYSEPCRDLYGFVLQEKLSESQARSLMYQAVLAAKHCLDGGVFHRDIKLDNYVINTATNRVQLIDFGCGEVAESGIKGQFIGFACPPEYFADFEYAAEPTTVWSLGIMMHRTVCSCNPLRKEDGRLSFDSRVSAEFQELITWCLALNPSERATMEDILQHEWFRQERMSGAI